MWKSTEPALSLPSITALAVDRGLLWPDILSGVPAAYPCPVLSVVAAVTS